MYYNEITKNFTKSEFRIKTEEELISDYDEDWREVGELDWVMGMDKYLGQDEDECYEYHVSDYCVTLNKHIDIDYNKPKQLVYEKLGEKILIIYKSESVEKVDELKEYLEDKIKQDFSNHWDEYICITSTLAYSFNLSEPNSGDVERSWGELGYTIVKCSTLEEVKNKIEFKFDSKSVYNKPKQLVYEKLEEKYAIVYKCGSNENTIKLINYLDIRGFNTDDLDKSLSSNYDFIIIRSSGVGSGNTIIYPIINPRMGLDFVIVSLERNDFVVYDPDNLKSLMELMGGEIFVDYNKPKQLVYEKKILSFKKFNDK